MRILYEGAIFQMLRGGGVARYFRELVQRLPGDLATTIVGPSEQTLELTRQESSYHGVRTAPPLRCLAKWTRPRYQQRIENQFNHLDADVDHWTYYNGLCRRSMVRSKRPLVVTIYDFVHEAFPTLDPSGRHIALKHRAIELADHLICISNATHNELCERFPSVRHKASVVPLGTSLSELPAASIPDELKQSPYVLFVGRRNDYKNFDAVLQAWQRLRGHRVDDAKLVLTGPPLRKNEAVWQASRDDASIVHLPDVSDSLLRGLYENAAAFVFPSKAEGFGLPSLEAMAAGTPVLASDLPVMREVVGACGYYFDPDDINELASLIKASLSGALPDVRDVVRAASERAASFTWTATAEKTAEIYRELARPREISFSRVNVSNQKAIDRAEDQAQSLHPIL